MPCYYALNPDKPYKLTTRHTQKSWGIIAAHLEKYGSATESRLGDLIPYHMAELPNDYGGGPSYIKYCIRRKWLIETDKPPQVTN